MMDGDSLRRVVKRAEFARIVRTDGIAVLLERYPRRRGRSRLARLAEAGILGGGRSRSELEDRFLQFCRRHRLPTPAANQQVEAGGRMLEVDFVWLAQRVAVELDGYRSHGGRVAFEDDRARDRALSAAGWAVVQVTWAQLHDDPLGLAAELRQILAHGDQRESAHTGRG